MNADDAVQKLIRVICGSLNQNTYFNVSLAFSQSAKTLACGP